MVDESEKRESLTKDRVVARRDVSGHQILARPSRPALYGHLMAIKGHETAETRVTPPSNNGRNILMTSETASYGRDTGNSLSLVADHGSATLRSARLRELFARRSATSTFIRSISGFDCRNQAIVTGKSRVRAFLYSSSHGRAFSPIRDRNGTP